MESFSHGYFAVHVLYEALHEMGGECTFEKTFVVVMVVPYQQDPVETNRHVESVVKRELTKLHPKKYLPKDRKEQVHFDLRKLLLVRAEKPIIEPGFNVSVLA